MFLTLLTDRISLTFVTFSSWDIGQYVYDLLSNMWRHKFKINLSFLIKPFFYITKKSGQKRKYLKNEKSF